MQLLANGKQQFIDSNGLPLANGQVYFYTPGTTTPATTYQDSAGLIPNTNPVVLDSNGQAVIWGNGTYRQVVLNASSVQVWDQIAATPDLNAPLTVLASSSGAALVGYGTTNLGALIGSHLNYVGNSIAALRAIDKTKYAQACITGYYASGDGGGGIYYYDSTDTTSVDNGASVIVAADGGRWKIVSQGRNSGQLFAESGASVARFGDRLFAGGATKHAGTNATIQADWLTTYQLARGRANGFIQSTQAAILQDVNNNTSNCLVVGAQTATLFDNYNAIGIIGVAAANKTTGTGYAYGGYFEAYRNIGALGAAYGLEVDNINYVAPVNIDPYQQIAGQTIGIQLAAGGQYSPTGQFPNSAAVNIRNNGSTYQRGIVFGSDSISGANGTTGTGIAIALGNGHKLAWFGSAGVATSSIYCSGTTAAGAVTQILAESAVAWQNPSGISLFQSVNVANAVNFFSTNNSTTNNPPQLLAQGSDANIDIQLVPKGTGGVWLGAYTAGVVSQAGYITVKDSGGTVRRLLVG